VTNPVRKAVIDVGTNSIKLLVAEIDGNGLRPIHEESKQTRLGRSFYETHTLLPEAIAQTAEVVSRFAEVARQHGAGPVRVIATSAARDAVNRKELTQSIREVSRLDTEIISGEQEAEFVFRGVATDPQLIGRRLLILDVGGGSTELVVGEGGHHTFRRSFELGSVRLLERLQPGDPPSAQDLRNCSGFLDGFFTKTIGPALDSALADTSQFSIVGTGGTTTILARMEKQLSTFSRAEIEGTVIQLDRVRFWMDKLWSASIAARKSIIGLPPNRADIIPLGIAIYEMLMTRLRFNELFVSTRGLRFGALIANE
jgi:exopolyphosphatase/guanosine-5'-triphosphate,3'-diphosphate pyrophosphatase